MKSILVLLPILALWGASARADEPQGDPARANQLREDLRQLIDSSRDKVFPALVNIEVVTVDYWDGREVKGRSVGSGTIISAEGHVLTNTHVVNNGKRYRCTLADKTEAPAELVGKDPFTDLAVLKIDLSAVKGGAAALSIGQFGNSDELQIGDYVMAMGSPFALSRSVSLGIVSNTERVFTGVMGGGDDPDNMQLEEGQRTGLFNRWIQHDALINPGNSGGPLVNLKGEIVGINARGGGSMGFAIPGNLARAVADSLIKLKEVPRSMLGVSLKPIKNTGFTHGVLVQAVVEQSPAQAGGVKAGDLIIKMNGEDTTVRFNEEIPLLARRIADLPIGSEVKLTLERAGQPVEVSLSTAKMEKDKGEERAFRAWGLTGLEITTFLAREWRLGSSEGVLVSGVREGGPAQTAEPALTSGDVIRSVGGEAIKSLDDLIKGYSKLMDVEKKPEKLLVEFDRKGKTFITLIKPRPDKDTDPAREVAKAWIGVATQPIFKNLAQEIECAKQPGFRVTRVYPGTLADKAGVKVGDLIVSLNGQPLAPRGQQEAGMFDRSIQKLNIGEEAKLGIKRCAESVDLAVALERTRLTPEEARRDNNRDFELSVREVTFFDRDENRWNDDVSGVLIEQVEHAGWAGLGGLAPGDLIQSIAGTEIKDITGYREVMDKIAKEQPERIMVVVLRGARTNFEFIEPDWKPKTAEEEKAEAAKENKENAK